MQLNQVGEFKKLLEERFPIVINLKPGKSFYQMEQVYTLFCQMAADFKPQKVLNLVAQQVNKGKRIERALADILEQLQNERSAGTSTKKQ